MDKDLELAMNNAYDIIIDYATIDQLIDRQPNQPIYLAFLLKDIILKKWSKMIIGMIL